MEPELLEELEVEDWSSTNVPQEENDSSLLAGVLHLVEMMKGNGQIGGSEEEAIMGKG